MMSYRLGERLGELTMLTLSKSPSIPVRWRHVSPSSVGVARRVYGSSCVARRVARVDVGPSAHDEKKLGGGEVEVVRRRRVERRRRGSMGLRGLRGG